MHVVCASSPSHSHISSENKKPSIIIDSVAAEQHREPTASPSAESRPLPLEVDPQPQEIEVSSVVY
jgi:hypothetical protein